MTGFKETEIGLIPVDWELKRIDSLFTIQQGKQVSKRNRIGNNQKRFLRTANVFWGKLDLTILDQMHFSESDEKRLKLHQNDLLVCEGGDIGRTAIWKQEIENCYYQNDLHRLRKINSDTYPSYYLFWLKYAFKIGKVYFGRANITTIPNLSKSRLSELLAPQPPFPEQRNIAYVLSTIQKAIEKQQQIIETTTELKKALMQKLFTEGLYGEKQKQTEIGLVPESWEVIELQNAVSYIDYGLSKAIPKIPPKDGIKIVSTADMTKDGKITYLKIRKTEAPEKTINRLKLNDGDVLFNWRNSAYLIGKTSVFTEQDDLHIFASFILRIKCDEIQIHNWFLSYLMNYFREIGVFIKLSRRAVNQANYNKNEISVLKIPLPKYDEQVEITTVFKILDKKIDNYIDIKTKLEELFKSMLHQLMTGQTRVNEIEFERR